jgi:hypothetical protein
MMESYFKGKGISKKVTKEISSNWRWMATQNIAMEHPKKP